MGLNLNHLHNGWCSLTHPTWVSSRKDIPRSETPLCMGFEPKPVEIDVKRIQIRKVKKDS